MVSRLLAWIIVNFSEDEMEELIPFPTPRQGIEQNDGTSPALQIAQIDRWTAVKIRSKYGVVRSKH